MRKKGLKILTSPQPNDILFYINIFLTDMKMKQHGISFYFAEILPYHAKFILI